MIIPQQVTDSFVPIAAGLIVSLFNKYILNSPRLDGCCQVETEEVDSESDKSGVTEMSDALSRASAITTSTLTPPHPIHYHHIHH